MHVDEVLCHGDNGGATWDTSHRGSIMRKVVRKAVTAGGRFDFFRTLVAVMAGESSLVQTCVSMTFCVT